MTHFVFLSVFFRQVTCALPRYVVEGVVGGRNGAKRFRLGEGRAQRKQLWSAAGGESAPNSPYHPVLAPLNPSPYLDSQDRRPQVPFAFNV